VEASSVLSNGGKRGEVIYRGELGKTPWFWARLKEEAK